MGTDHRRLYEQATSYHLATGEFILALTEAKRPHGLAPVRVSSPSPADPDTAARQVTMRAADVALSGAEFVDNIGGGGPIDLLIRLLFGRALIGSLNSVAGGYAVAVPTDNKLLVVVTERRLFVFRILPDYELTPLGAPPKPAGPDRLKPLWWAARDDVAGARCRWHRLHGARLRITFRDGSWLELTGPLCMGRRRANELRDALS